MKKAKKKAYRRLSFFLLHMVTSALKVWLVDNSQCFTLKAGYQMHTGFCVPSDGKMANRLSPLVHSLFFCH